MGVAGTVAGTGAGAGTGAASDGGGGDSDSNDKDVPMGGRPGGDSTRSGEGGAEPSDMFFMD